MDGGFNEVKNKMHRLSAELPDGWQRARSMTAREAESYRFEAVHEASVSATPGTGHVARAH